MIKKTVLAAVSVLLIVLIGYGNNKVQKTNASSQESINTTDIIVPGSSKDDNIQETNAPSRESRISVTDAAEDINYVTAESDEDTGDSSISDSQFKDILDNIIFIGDSVTSGFGGYQKVSMSEVFAENGVGPSNVRKHTFDYNGGEYDALTILASEASEYVVISMGLNDINTYTPEDFSELYMDFVEDAMEVSSSSQFYIFSITPVSVECENITNDTIDKINILLEKNVSEYGGNLHYVDCNSVLKDDTGYMNEEYSGGDGIHFNSEAYDIMLEQLKKSIGN